MAEGRMRGQRCPYIQHFPHATLENHLYMAKIIIEKNMNGLLSVRNTGEGAEFRIEIKYGEVVTEASPDHK